MEETWFYTHGGGGSFVKLAGSKNISVEGEEINTIFTSDVVKSLKINKRSKSKAVDDFDLNNESKILMREIV